MHLEHAKFLRAAGGRTLQIIDERPKRALVAADYARLGKLLTAVGRRTAELGVETVYHHHMNSIGEKPQELDAVLETVDPKAVGILFDIAHYQQGGGDPVAAIRKYRDRIKVVHLKDVRAIDKAPGYEWVELGRGRVDVKGCVAALKDDRLQGLGDHRAGQGARRRRIAESVSAREQAVRDAAARARSLNRVIEESGNRGID